MHSTSSSISSSSSSIAEPPIATLSFQDEQKTQTPQPQPKPVTTQPRTHFTSSHHHYHLPHQFQHPHHQNHHTHSVRVPTPTVPSSYAPPPPPPTDDGFPEYSRKSYIPAMAAPVLSSSLLSAASGEGATAHVTAAISPGRASARSGSQHHVTIDESSLPRKSSVSVVEASAGPSGIVVGGGDGDGDRDVGGGGGGGGGGDSSDPPSSPGSSSQQVSGSQADGQLALMYHSHQLTNYPAILPAIKRTHRPSFVYPPMPRVKA
ncbi:GL16465 [Drosophila persimilis]|uniref:GL16465 n=1 Tax=Drosophila persimilis TaxID=7234 RepID=B4GWD3_DROPE|nr:GL16465 [Drosophila persimilis]